MKIDAPRRMGRHGLTVTPLGFGGGPIGDRAIDTGIALATVQTAFAGGVRFFDTAPYYGIGRSERRLGMALGDLGPDVQFRINTKVGRTLEPEPVRDESRRTMSPGGGVRTPRDRISGHRVHFDYSEGAILQQHRDSLQRLGLSRVDSLAIHDIDHGHQWPEEVDTALRQLSRQGGRGANALEGLRDAGLISAIGAGCNREMRNFETWDGGRQEDLIERLADTVDLDFLILAGPYTLLDTIALHRVIPLCAARGISLVIASPFAGGWLADPERISYMYGDTPDDVRFRTRQLQDVCQAFGVPLAAAALQFVLAHPLVAAAIPGAKSAAEAAATRQLLDVTLPADFWRQLKQRGLLDEEAPTP